MTTHLLVIALGPVQDFIAAARRTRDLWFGSFLLSEISKATARVCEQGGKLIFPNPADPDNDLKPGSDFNVVNVILVELRPGLQPKDVVAASRTAATECWKGYAAEAQGAAEALIDKKVRCGKTLWDEQIDDVIEFYAAWVPLKSDEDYPKVRKEVMLLLNGRKALRDFKFHQGHEKVPKSSLDGARESVLVPKQSRQVVLSTNKRLAQRLRLSRGEELDAVGLTKRAAIKEVFASVVRVAADPWIRGIDEDGDEGEKKLKAIAEECRKIIIDYTNEETAHVTGTGRHYRDTIFPYDGAVLFPLRLDSMLRIREDEVDVLEERQRMVFSGIRDKLLPELQKDLGYGEPEPYLAILIADGDRMGKAISAISSADRHREFSRQLAEFAGKARTIVKDHHGCLVYTGGDDVLAFVPVDRCLDCARALHDQFGELLKDFKGHAGHPPTLSVGIAIGHCLEPLEDLLRYARDAEKNAKESDRNGLAVHLHTRGGPPVYVRARWVDAAANQQSLDKRLRKWADLHLEERISDKAVYDLRQLSTQYANWPATPSTEQAMKKDIAHLFSRKEASGKKLDTSQFEAELEMCFTASERASIEQQRAYRDHHPGVMHLAAEWIIARKIAHVMRQARGKQAKEPKEADP